MQTPRGRTASVLPTSSRQPIPAATVLRPKSLSAQRRADYHRPDPDGASRMAHDPPPDAPSSPPRLPPALNPETTIELLQRVKEGDDSARERLIARCLPALTRWAHGRLPPIVRDVNETSDLVQDTVLAALRHLGAFEARREGALQAYLRQALANRIKDLLRQRMRRPIATELSENLVDGGESPLDRAIGASNVDRYERALERLRPEDREAIFARLELQYDYDELAIALDKPSANAARVGVMRALHRLAKEMKGGPSNGNPPTGGNGGIGGPGGAPGVPTAPLRPTPDRSTKPQDRCPPHTENGCS